MMSDSVLLRKFRKPLFWMVVHACVALFFIFIPIFALLCGPTLRFGTVKEVFSFVIVFLVMPGVAIYYSYMEFLLSVEVYKDKIVVKSISTKVVPFSSVESFVVGKNAKIGWTAKIVTTSGGKFRFSLLSDFDEFVELVRSNLPKDIFKSDQSWLWHLSKMKARRAKKEASSGKC